MHVPQQVAVGVGFDECEVIVLRGAGVVGRAVEQEGAVEVDSGVCFGRTVGAEPIYAAFGTDGNRGRLVAGVCGAVDKLGP